MSVRQISSRLQKILHSLATRVPKIVLQRAEDIFPALNTSLTVSIPEETDFGSSQQLGHLKKRMFVLNTKHIYAPVVNSTSLHMMYVTKHLRGLVTSRHVYAPILGRGH